jgi:GAF domain-containing protein
MMSKSLESGAKPPEARSPAPPVDPEAPGRLFEMVARAAAAAAYELDASRLVEVILDQMRLLGATVTVLFAADVQRRELTLLGQRGVPPDVVKRLDRVPFDAPLVSARAAATCELQLFQNRENLEPATSLTSEVLRRTETASVLGVPLMVAGKLVGVLMIANSEARRFPEEEILAIRAIADVFAASLNTARTHERDRLQLESLHLATLAISAPIALSSVLQNIVDQARSLTGASYAALGILDAEATDGPFNPWVFSGVIEREAALLGRPPRPVGLLGAVAREGRSIRTRNLVEDARFRGFPPHHPPMTSFLGVPIFYFDHVVGNLYLTNKRDADEFSEDDQRVVEMFAQHASIAVEHAREHALLVQEIAQRKRDQDALRASEERFRRLAEGAQRAAERRGA